MDLARSKLRSASVKTKLGYVIPLLGAVFAAVVLQSDNPNNANNAGYILAGSGLIGLGVTLAGWNELSEAEKLLAK
jgi:hypothetical protein